MSVFTLLCKGADSASPLFSGSFCTHLSMFAFPDALWLWKKKKRKGKTTPSFIVQECRGTGKAGGWQKEPFTKPDHCLTGLIKFVYLYPFIVAVQFESFLFVCFAWWPSFVGSSVRTFSQEILTAFFSLCRTVVLCSLVEYVCLCWLVGPRTCLLSTDKRTDTDDK